MTTASAALSSAALSSAGPRPPGPRPPGPPPRPDPGWASLRRARPDADLILLPPMPPVGPDPDGPQLPQDTLRALVEVCHAEFDALLAVLEEAAESVETLPPLWWSQAAPDRRRYVLEAVACGFGGFDRGGPVVLASRLVGDWRHAGWRVRDGGGPHPSARADLGPVEASVTTYPGYPGRLVVSVRSSAVRIDPELAARLSVGDR